MIKLTFFSFCAQTTAIAVVGLGVVGLGIAEAVTAAQQNTNTNQITTNTNQITSNANNLNTVCNTLTTIGGVTPITIPAAGLAVNSVNYNALVSAINSIINAGSTCTSNTG